MPRPFWATTWRSSLALPTAACPSHSLTAGAQTLSGTGTVQFGTGYYGYNDQMNVEQRDPGRSAPGSRSQANSGGYLREGNTIINQGTISDTAPNINGALQIDPAAASRTRERSRSAAVASASVSGLAGSVSGLIRSFRFRKYALGLSGTSYTLSESFSVPAGDSLTRWTARTTPFPSQTRCLRVVRSSWNGS